MIPGAYLEDLCFDAQQAAEKAIKAVMIARDMEFPYVHDLDQLLTLGKPVIPKECKRLAEVDFPITEVSRHAAREKPIRQGPPSTLHI